TNFSAIPCGPPGHCPDVDLSFKWRLSDAGQMSGQQLSKEAKNATYLKALHAHFACSRHDASSVHRRPIENPRPCRERRARAGGKKLGGAIWSNHWSNPLFFSPANAARM